MQALFLPKAAALVPMLLALSAVPGWSQVSGWVLEPDGVQPVADALVSLQASSERTLSAADGSFSLPGAIGSDLVVVAAKKGYYNRAKIVTSPADRVKIRIPRVTDVSDPNYWPQSAHECGTCHWTQFRQWQESPMAHSGVNTWLYDIYDGSGTPGGAGGFVYTRDSVHAATEPASDCAPCHQAVPWVMHLDPERPLEDIHALSPEAEEGVSCEVCHKISDVNESHVHYPGLHPAGVTFSKPRGSHQVEYGALGDSSYLAPAVMEPSYQPQLTAAVCAACHQDKNDPDEDGDYEEANGVVSEPTYLEWLNSPYGDPAAPEYATCVTCHMPSFGATRLTDIPGVPLRDPETIRHHDVRGTTPEFLENAVEMWMNVQVTAATLEVDVAILNSMTGHHVPTGVTVRNMILVVEAWRAAGGVRLEHTGAQVVHDLGGVGDPALGYYAGLPGKLYAKVNHDGAGNGPTFFTDATGILWDNRIPALATDTTHYSFALPSGSGTPHVRARLIYRRAFRSLVDAKQWTEDGHGCPLEDVQPPFYGHLMEEAQWPAYISDLTAHGLAGGAEATLAVAGAAPSRMVWFLASQTGAGPTTTSRGFALDLSPPILPLGSTRTDRSGVARFSFPVPPGATGRRVRIQAVVAEGGRFLVTNVVEQTVR